MEQEDETITDFQNISCFEIILPAPKQKTISKSEKKKFVFLQDEAKELKKKKSIKINNIENEHIKMTKKIISSKISEKITNIKDKILENKFKNLIKKSIKSFSEGEDQSMKSMNVVLLKIKSCYSEYSAKFKQYFSEESKKKDALVYEINSDEKINNIRKKIIEDLKTIETNEIFMISSEIFNKIEIFSDYLKLLFEEICDHPRLKLQASIRLNVLFLVSSNFSFETNKSHQIKVKELSFIDSKNLFMRFCLEILKDVNFYPILELSVLEKLINDFDNYNISFTEAVRRFKILTLTYLNTFSENQKHFDLLYEFLTNDNLNNDNNFANSNQKNSKNDKNNDKSNKNFEFLNSKAQTGDIRSEISLAINLLIDILKTQLEMKNQEKIIELILRKEKFKITSKSRKIKDNELIDKISECILQSNYNIQGIFSDFSKNELNNKEIFQEKKKSLSQKDKRYSEILRLTANNTNINTLNFNSKSSDLIQIEKAINYFIEKYINSKYDEFFKEVPYYFIDKNIYEEFQKIINPDILGNVHESIFSKPNDTADLLEIIEKKERNFEINQVFAEFTEKKKSENQENNEKINLEFFYALNELQYLGFVEPKQKSKLVFNKNVFAKTFFNDYSVKTKKN